MRGALMQRDRIAVARTWLRTSSEDAAVAKALFETSPSRSAFHAQQSAEFALKAATIALSDDHQRTHSLRVLIRELESLGETISERLRSDALALELFYTSTRYPDSVNDGDPAEFVDLSTARQAFQRSQLILTYATAIVDRVANSEENNA